MSQSRHPRIVVHSIILTVLFTFALARSVVAGDGGDAFTFQGQLEQSGAPATGPLDLVFRLYDFPALGTQQGPAIPFTNYTSFDSSGRFSVDLAFGPTAFPGAARWLEIEVEGVKLTPRQRINPVPYATRSLEVAQVNNAALTGTYSNALTMSNGSNQFGGTFAGTHTGNGLGLTSISAGSLTNGFIPNGVLNGTYGSILTMTNVNNNFGGTFNGTVVGNGSGLSLLNASNISSGTLSADRLPKPLALSGTNAGSYILQASNSSTTDGSSGVKGWANSSSGETYGGYFVSNSAAGTGVVGEATSTGVGVTNGVLGRSAINAGRGVYGISTNSVEGGTGGYFEAAGPVGRGVYARATSPSGESKAIEARVDSSQGHGLWITGPQGSMNYIQRPLGVGVQSPTHLLEIGSSGTGFDQVLGSIGALSLHTSGVERVRFTEDGNVGIGTTEPEDLLAVQGAIVVDSGNANVGTVSDALRFGTFSGEAIASRRQAGDNQWGLDFYTNFDNQMSITNAGDVGIGTTNPGAKLEVNGSAAKPGGGSWSNASDARLKKNVAPLAHALDDLLRLRGVTYEYIDPKAINELEGMRMGFIAQQVEEIFPDWVEMAPNGFRRMTIRGFEALAVEAMRQLRAEKDAELAARDAEIEALRERLDRLEAAVAALSPDRTGGAR